MEKLVKVVATLAIAVFGLGAAYYLKNRAPIPNVDAPAPRIQSVSVKKVNFEEVAIPVYSRGEVAPGSEIQLVMEVAGQVNYLSPNLASGGFFKKGEVLVKVDDGRYKLDVTKAEARVVSAKQKYSRMKSELSVDEDIAGLPSPRRYRQRQLNEALAQVEAAEADLKLVMMQLEKAVLRAPFDGRVRQALVGRGQYISPGIQLAQVYTVDLAEVRLPLSDRQLALVDMPNSPKGMGTAPFVTFKLSYGEQDYFWQGKIVRTEGGLDVRNRLLYAVAEIPTPYAQDPMQPGRPPLPAGQFLEAEIQGRIHRNIVVLPRKVLRSGREIWVVEKGRLYRRDVELLYKSSDQVFIKKGLKAGESVVMTPIDIAIEGMRVRTNRFAEDVAQSGRQEIMVSIKKKTI